MEGSQVTPIDALNGILSNYDRYNFSEVEETITIAQLKKLIDRKTESYAKKWLKKKAA